MRNPLILTGVLMTLTAFITVSPALSTQFNFIIGLSVALFLFILLAWSLGWVQPTGIPVSA